MVLCGPPGSGKTMTLFSALRALPDLEVKYSVTRQFELLYVNVMFIAVLSALLHKDNMFEICRSGMFVPMMKGFPSRPFPLYYHTITKLFANLDIKVNCLKVSWHLPFILIVYQSGCWVEFLLGHHP